ncbi:hypothetical protein ACWHAO_31390 [Streptomyces albidoflavus]|nr:hypothetical protein [Streptomyces sp. L06]
MVELGILAGAAVGIAGDFLAGVVQDVAASTVADLVRQRLGSTGDGTRALERLEETPQDSGRRMEAASVLATATQSDPSFAQALNDAVNVYHQNTDQGTATSGSPHHQVNISGGGISGKGHQVAGGNIDNSKKRNIRIGFGAFALLAVVLGGYGVTQWASGDGGTKADEKPSTSGETVDPQGSAVGDANVPDSKKVNFDIQGRYTDLGGGNTFYRARGEVTATVGQPIQSDDDCGLRALPGKSIVPVTFEVINKNDPSWASDSSKFDPDTATISAKDVPEGVTAYTRNEVVNCVSGIELGSRSGSGSVNTATLILQGIPEGGTSEITLEVKGPDSVLDKYQEGMKYEEGRPQSFLISIQG